MNTNSQRWDMVKKIGFIVMIISALASLSVFFISIIKTPCLTYEEGYYPLQEGKSLAFILVKNEGRKTANTVNICITAKGEIENVATQKGLIIGKIGEAELFKEAVSSEIIDNSSCKVIIPHIVNGIKYTLCLTIKHGKGDPIDGVIVESINGGIAKKYTQKGSSFSKIFISGFILGICLTLVVYYYMKKKSKDL